LPTLMLTPPQTPPRTLSILVQMRAGETFQIHHEFVTECRHGHVSNADLRKALYYAVTGPSATDDTPREVRTAT